MVDDAESPSKNAKDALASSRVMRNSQTETTVDLKRVEERMDRMELGITRLIGQFTVTPSAASTTVTLYGCSSRSCVLLMPLDATTATEYGLGTTYVTPAKGSFVVTHPNNASSRSYRYVVFSGIRL